MGETIRSFTTAAFNLHCAIEKRLDQLFGPDQSVIRHRWGCGEREDTCSAAWPVPTKRELLISAARRLRADGGVRLLSRSLGVTRGRASSLLGVEARSSRRDASWRAVSIARVAVPDSGKFYVYTLRDSATSLPFYVGKGTRRGRGERVDQHELTARAGWGGRHLDRIRAIWAAGGHVVKTIERFFEDEEDAFVFEARLIDLIGLDRLDNASAGWRTLAQGRGGL